MDELLKIISYQALLNYWVTFLTCVSFTLGQQTAVYCQSALSPANLLGCFATLGFSETYCEILSDPLQNRSERAVFQ